MVAGDDSDSDGDFIDDLNDLTQQMGIKGRVHSLPELGIFFAKKMPGLQVARSPFSDGSIIQTGYLGVSTLSKDSISDDSRTFEVFGDRLETKT